MYKLLIFIYFLLQLQLVSSYIFYTNFQSGRYHINFVYNNETIQDSVVAFTYASGSELYFQTVYANSTTLTILCRQATQQRIVTGPNGCSNIVNPLLALQSANCIQNEIDVELRRDIFAITWYLSRTSNECLLKGGNGDPRLCSGPLLLSQDNLNSFLPNQPQTVISFLSSRTQFLSCLTGPLAMSPCIVQIQMVLPEITAITNCTHSILGTFAGAYSVTELDPYPGIIVHTWKVFVGPKPSLRLLLVRSSPLATTFRIILGDNTGPAGNFSYLYQSDIITDGNAQTEFAIFHNWLQDDIFNRSFRMYNVSDPSVQICSLNLTLPSEDSLEYTIIPPEIVTVANYPFNLDPPPLYRTRVCNYGAGRLDSTGLLIYSDCLEGDNCGGTATYTSQLYPNLQIFVPPDPTLAFRLDCVEKYPSGETFTDLNGIVIPRISIQEGQCFFPFLSEALITSNTLPSERFIQCQKQGGYTWGKAMTHCASTITQIECMPGWIYFDQRCFYKFDPVADTRYSVVLDQSENACTLLNPYAKPLIEVDIYTDAWIQRDYIWWKRDIMNSAAYRVPRIGGGARCSCYNTVNYILDACDCYTLELITFTTSEPTSSPTVTKSPTKSPSKKPTKTPTTQSPTTKSPTTTPTTGSPTKTPTTTTPTTAWPSSISPTKTPTTSLPTTKSPTSDPSTSWPSSSLPTKKPSTTSPTIKPTTRTPTSKPVITEVKSPIFPICYYDAYEPALEPKYKYTSLSLATATTWVKGQIGPEQDGNEAVCQCFDGWTGKNCERATCPLSTALVEGASSSLVNFMKKCTNLKRGSCWNGQPRCCQCNFGYGPSACVLPDLPWLYEFVNMPCACPAGIQTYGSFRINGLIYTQNVLGLPCSGIDQGSCTVDNATNIGTCGCETRENLVYGGTDFAYDGDRCACPTAIQPFNADVKNGPINTGICNGIGACCPGGQTLTNPYVGDMEAPACFEKNGDKIQGCSCPNGFGGSSCTCPTPNDRCDLRNIQVTNTDPNYVYVDMGELYFIHYIRINDCGSFTSVGLSNQINSPDASYTCTFNSTLLLYECNSPLSFQYVVLSNAVYTSTCIINAYERYFQYCGANETINVFAGRFFALPTYRGQKKNLNQQFVGVANYGCTNTECACNSNYGGQLCALGVSAIRPTTIIRYGISESIWAKRYCGEENSLPTLFDFTQGRGQLDETHLNCSCNMISSVDVTGTLTTEYEYFTGVACQCVFAYNPDYGESLMCAGHGECITPSFPYGRCEVDLIDYENDALFEPFISVTSYDTDTTEMTLIEDSYFISGIYLHTDSPTKMPTANPTKMPTDSPTRSPTTKSPTIKPTTATPTTKSPTTASPTPVPSYVQLYPLASTMNGNLGSYSDLTQMCVDRAPFYSLTCRVIKPFVSYPSFPIENWPSLYGFIPSSTRVVGLSGLAIAFWDVLFSTYVLFRSLAQVGTLPFGTEWWSGSLPYGGLGIPSQVCTYWTTSSSLVNGIHGDSDALNDQWITGGTVVPCDELKYVLCGCIFDV